MGYQNDDDEEGIYIGNNSEDDEQEHKDTATHELTAEDVQHQMRHYKKQLDSSRRKFGIIPPKPVPFKPLPSKLGITEARFFKNRTGSKTIKANVNIVLNGWLRVRNFHILETSGKTHVGYPYIMDKDGGVKKYTDIAYALTPETREQFTDFILTKWEEFLNKEG